MAKKQKNITEELEVKPVQRLLLVQFYGYISLALLVLALFEFDILPLGYCADSTSLQYYLLVIMELLTIACVPLALKLFSLKKVKHRLYEQGFPTLGLWGSIRMGLIGLPLLLNVVLYELTIAATFGYLAIITSLCLAFVFPSENRCLNEIDLEE